jgi:hypothetical protein
VYNEIEAISEFDGRTVLGFLGDFGIEMAWQKAKPAKKAANG